MELLFLIILSNAGGEGKTLLAYIFEALLQLRQQSVLTFCGDVGNRAAKEGNPNAMTVSWTAAPEQAADMVEVLNGRHLVFDTGANMMAAGQAIGDLPEELGRRLRAQGYRTIAVLPVSTNKIGAAGALQRLADKIVGFEKVFVQNDRDGSGAFGTPLAGNVVDLENLQPGFVAVTNKLKKSIAQVVSDPPDRYKKASKVISSWLGEFERQPAIADIFKSFEEVSALRSVCTSEYHIRVETLEDAADDALAENQRSSKRIMHVVGGGMDSQAFRATADWIDAGEPD